MNVGSAGAASKPEAVALESLQEIWVLLVGTGLGLIAVGGFAIGSSFIAELATLVVFGLLLILGAIFQVVNAFWARRWRGFVLPLLAGVLYLNASVSMVDSTPGGPGLTQLVAACLLVAGILRVVVSQIERFDGWVWALVHGIVSIALGLAIWRQWPLSGLWLIGLYFGIDMLFSGVSWVLLGLVVRSASRRTSGSLGGKDGH
jgi:uncharacterized membrane protein HdeD (DUF308 family)